MSIRKATGADLQAIDSLIKDSYQKFRADPNDIKEVYVYENDITHKLTGVLTTGNNLSKIIASAGEDSPKLLRMFEYNRYNTHK